jgi:hypothetical protein
MALPNPFTSFKELAMNHILRLIKDRNDLRAKLAEVRDELAALEKYYTSDKFAGPDNDYAHVRTDLLPRLSTLKSLAIEDLLQRLYLVTTSKA